MIKLVNFDWFLASVEHTVCMLDFARIEKLEASRWAVGLQIVEPKHPHLCGWLDCLVGPNFDMLSFDCLFYPSTY